jgi:hypothetical protein
MSAHRCWWCRSKMARVAPLRIAESDHFACKPRCRALAEQRLATQAAATRAVTR